MSRIIGLLIGCVVAAGVMAPLASASERLRVNCTTRDYGADSGYRVTLNEESPLGSDVRREPGLHASLFEQWIGGERLLGEWLVERFEETLSCVPAVVYSGPGFWLETREASPGEVQGTLRAVKPDGMLLVEDFSCQLLDI